MSFLKSKKIKKFFNFFIVLSISTFVFSSPLLILNNKHKNISAINNQEIDSNIQENIQMPSEPSGIELQLDDFLIAPNFAPTIPLQSLNSNELSFEIKDSFIDLDINDNKSIRILENSDIKHASKNDVINFDNSSLFFSTRNIDKYANVKYANKNVNLLNVVNNKNLIIAKDYYSDDIQVFSPFNESTISIDSSRLNINNEISPSDFIRDKNNFYKKIKINFNNVISQTINDTKIKIIPVFILFLYWHKN